MKSSIDIDMEDLCYNKGNYMNKYLVISQYRKGVFMKERNKYLKYATILLIGIAILVPAFNISFIHQGNYIDKAFFFAALLGYIILIIAIVSGCIKIRLKK